MSALNQETKHTPGPWIVDATPSHAPCRFIVRAKGEKCDTWVPLADCCGSSKEANAHLIAAAPNQHEALKTIQQLSAAALHDDRMSIETVLKLLRDIEVVSRVAIYSAEGRSL